MRKIIFRGKRIRPKGVEDAWAYGSLIQRIDTTEIHAGVFTWNVYPETVGQFTGLTDKNGKEIYEGDILYMWNTGMKKAIVKFTHGTFALFVEDDKYLQPLNPQYWLDSEIIGNIHDNPELINKEKTNVKQQICYKTNEPCPYDCKGLCRDSM